ncbi:MAG: hypothetical protein ACRBB6_05940 [Neptuniibacter sp.]
MANDLFLVKNLHQDRVIYYWVNPKGKRLSPLHHTQATAEDWWKKFLFSKYTGVERRKTIVDRRNCGNTREIMNQRTNICTDPVGRRYTDHAVKIDYDLYDRKIKDFVASIN